MRTPKTRLPGDRVVHSHPDFVGLARHLKIYIYIYIYLFIYLFIYLLFTCMYLYLLYIEHTLSDDGVGGH